VSIRKFVRKNRAEIDEIIREQIGRTTISDNDRIQWVKQYDELSNWARNEGVEV